MRPLRLQLRLQLRLRLAGKDSGKDLGRILERKNPLRKIVPGIDFLVYNVDPWFGSILGRIWGGFWGGKVHYEKLSQEVISCRECGCVIPPMGRWMAEVSILYMGGFWEGFGEDSGMGKSVAESCPRR